MMRLPQFRTSMRKLFSAQPRRRVRNKASAFAHVHKKAAGNFPEGFDPADERHVERLSRAIAADALFVLEDYAGRMSPDWYSSSVDSMMEIMEARHPELAYDDRAASAEAGFADARDARCVFFSALAITSQGVPVKANARFALDQFEFFLANGRFDPRSLGPNGRSIKNNLDRFNRLLAAAGSVSDVRRVFESRIGVREFRALMEVHGISAPLRESVHETVSGSLVLGPKIGCFYQNLSGNEDEITIDMWLMRTLGRLTGNLLAADIPASVVDRLANSLRNAQEDPLAEPGLAACIESIDASLVTSMDRDELGSFATGLVRQWERFRKNALASGTTQLRALEMKQESDWPLAALAAADWCLKTIDTPSGGGQRRMIRHAMRRASQIVVDHGHPMTPARLQALLWYPEKHLASVMTGRGEPAINVAFDEAFAELLEERNGNGHGTGIAGQDDGGRSGGDVVPGRDLEIAAAGPFPG
jgi:hypothetical protein